MNKLIFLIGMMGCGKSTLGSLLARELNAPFLDLDEDIVRFEGRSIPEIFADVGDAGFRTADIFAEGMTKVSCTKMGDLVAERIK